MPTNQTANYALNQWVKSDQVQMEDFNADNAKIDAAVKAVADRVTTLEQPRFYMGSYTGDGKDSRTIQLPWAPKLMLLFTYLYKGSGIVILTQQYNCYMYPGTVVHDSTYRVHLNGASLVITHTDVNRQGELSQYILLR